MLALFLRFAGLFALSLLVVTCNRSPIVKWPKGSFKSPGLVAKTDLQPGQVLLVASPGQASFTFLMLDPDEIVSHAVLFATVNKEEGNGIYRPSVGQLIFSEMSI